MKKKAQTKKHVIGSGSFIIAGIVVMLIPAALYVVLGDFASFVQQCALPFSSIDIGGLTFNCTELRFVYVLSYFCLLFGLILIILGLFKKARDEKKTVN